MKIKTLGLIALLSIQNLIAQKSILLENFNLIDVNSGQVVKGKSLIIAADTIHSIFEYGAQIPALEFERIELRNPATGYTEVSMSDHPIVYILD